MNPKYVKYIIYIVILIVIMLVGFYFGKSIEAGIGALLVFLGIRKSNKDKLKDAQKNIDEAGDVDAKKHDTDSALDFFDKFFGNNDSSK